ncbi:MAG: ribonuclease III domain-containing protein [Hornefia sp.]|nr:ribonuclease III domain-containing protein [Hornefia sp.]
MKVNSKVTDTTALAYIGDAVYEVFIRRHVLESGLSKVDKMNRKVVRYVCADGQARIAKTLIKGFLSDDEVKLLKRGRNNTKTPKPRGSSPMDYKMATGFETLIGYLYMRGDTKRLEEVIKESVEIIESEV